MAKRIPVSEPAKGDVSTTPSTPDYTSTNPQGDWQRFQDAMKTIVSVPKKQVDDVIKKDVPQKT